MKILVINTSALHWKIKRRSKSEHKFLSRDNFIILNPYHYSKAYSKYGLLGNFNINLKDNCLITTNGILVRYNDNQEIQFNELFDYMASFLRVLRHQSMQAEIKANGYINSMYSDGDVTRAKLENRVIDDIAMRSLYYNTMIVWQNIIDSDKSLFNKKMPPVYEEILLDALSALTSNQYDKTILFSAISIESMLAITFDKQYELILKKKDNIRYRVTKSYKDTFKDSIYEALTSGTDFKKLLHQIPLYLSNKSILIDNEKLYQNLIRLYSTRNKIVHWGAPIDEDSTKRIELNEKGARLAFEIMLDTYLWMGITRFEILRQWKFVTIDK
jgi:hypothetical protein